MYNTGPKFTRLPCKIRAVITCFTVVLTGICSLQPFWASADAYHRKVDSLIEIFEHNPSASKSYDAGMDLLHLCQNHNSDSALLFGRRLLKKTVAIGNLSGAMMTSLEISSIFLGLGHADSIRSYLNQALLLGKKTGKPRDMIECYLFFSRFYEYAGKRDSSLYALLQAEEISLTSPPDPVESNKLLPEIGKFYFRQGVYDKAIDYLNRSMENYRKIDSLGMSAFWSDIGNVYYWQKNYPEALKCYLEGYRNNRFYKDTYVYAYLGNNIGLVYHAFGKYDSAKHYYIISLQNYKKSRNNEGVANVLINLSKTNDSLKEYKEGLQNAQEALKLVFALGVHGYGQQYDVYGVIADLYNKMGMYQKAFEAQLKKTIIGDTISKRIPFQGIVDVQTRLETAAKNAENKALKAQNSARYAQLLLIGSVSVLLLIIVFIMYRYSRRDRKNLALTTEQKELIEQKNVEITHQKHELELANDFRNKLFTIISHDVKEPVTTLQAYVMMMQEGMLNEEENKKMTGELSKTISGTLSFIENLLAWARLQMDGFEPEHKPVKMRETVDSTINLYQSKITDKNLHIINAIDPEQMAYTDVNIIEMVLRNLLSNAMKFTPKGGNITVSSIIAGDKIEISVADTGIGIPEEVAKQLFSGKRNSTRGTDDEAGHGMGLVFCKDSLEKAGGDLYLKSSSAQGTVFGFLLPVGDGVTVN